MRGRGSLLGGGTIGALVALVLWLGERPGASAGPDEPPQPELSWLLPPAWSPGWGEVVLPELPSSEALATLRPRGQVLFQRLCVACHGPGGRGDGVLAGDLPRPPRDLAGEPLRTRAGSGPASPAELYRTLTAGAAAYGMPAFDHLAPDARWSLVAHVLALRAAGDTAAVTSPLPALPPPPASIDLELGRATWQARCVLCHGDDGRGAPQAARELDLLGRPCPPPDLTRGPEALRGGARLEDLARSIHLGRPGTHMVPTLLEPAALWSTAAWVERLVRAGAEARRRGWDELFRARRALAREPGATPGEPLVRWDAEQSAGFAVAPEGQRGCSSCHEGISPIASGAMGLSLDACAGGDPDRACALCHEGRPAADTKLEAHAGLIGNPGSLWVTSVGRGCGKCHSERGALTSLLGLPLPEPTGGGLLAVTSRRTDPTGATGRNHAYRMQRALMAQETGKTWLGTASAGLVERDAPRFTVMPVDDPDGPVPSVGSEAYRAFMARALAAGDVKRLPRGEGLPTRARARELLGDDGAAAYVDTYRKECARCHLWGEGRPTRGERRSSGCSACHLLNGIYQRSLEPDPTIPEKLPGHVARHELVVAIPEAQCNHCHTRGVETLHTDVHQVAGIGCVDCHTSIDVHGDGNIYASIPHQLEVRCEDCHGTATQPPWELPVGHGTAAASRGARGTARIEGRELLLTSRGNVRGNWIREGDDVVVVSLLDGKRHVTPPLRAAKSAPPAAAPAGHSGDAPGHAKLACAACHNRAAPACFQCHVTWLGGVASQDWVLSALDYDPASLRQGVVLTPGTVEFKDSGPAVWDPPGLRPDPDGTLTPRITGCKVNFQGLTATGELLSFSPRMNPGFPGYPPPVAPSLPHENSLRPRGCEECHPERR